MLAGILMRKEEQRFPLGPHFSNRTRWLLRIKRDFLIHLRRRSPQCAQLHPLKRINPGAQFFRGEIKLMRCEPKIVVGISLSVTLFESLKSRGKKAFNRDRFVDYEHGVFQIIEDARAAFLSDRHQPLPTGKILAFVGKDSAVAQRTRKTFIAPALAGTRGPFTEV